MNELSSLKFIFLCAFLHVNGTVWSQPLVTGHGLGQHLSAQPGNAAIVFHDYVLPELLLPARAPVALAPLGWPWPPVRLAVWW
jgi:hypothetical protein